MLKYAEKENDLEIYLNEREKCYSISTYQLGKIVNWSLFSSGKFKFPNLSNWVLHLCTSRSVNKEFLIELSNLIKSKCPNNSINWELTFRVVDMEMDFMDLLSKEKHPTQGPRPNREARIKYRNEAMNKIIAKYQL